MTHHNIIMNLNISLSKFIVLQYITFSTRFIFFWTKGVVAKLSEQLNLIKLQILF